MSRFGKASSYSHKIRAVPWGGYRMSWVVDFYYPHSMLRFPRMFTRDTDDIKAAERFCKKHGIEMPKDGT